MLIFVTGSYEPQVERHENLKFTRNEHNCYFKKFGDCLLLLALIIIIVVSSSSSLKSNLYFMQRPDVLLTWIGHFFENSP